MYFFLCRIINSIMSPVTITDNTTTNDTRMFNCGSDVALPATCIPSVASGIARITVSSES